MCPTHSSRVLPRAPACLSQGPQGGRTPAAAPGLWGAAPPSHCGYAPRPSPRALGPPGQRVPPALAAAASELPAALGGDGGEPALPAGEAVPPGHRGPGVPAVAAARRARPAGPRGVRQRGRLGLGLGAAGHQGSPGSGLGQGLSLGCGGAQLGSASGAWASARHRLRHPRPERWGLPGKKD